MVERVAAGWFCNVCGKPFAALTLNDRRYLHSIGVTPEE